MARATHPPAVKARALELYAEHGPAETSRILGTEGHEVSAALVRKWASRGGIVTVTAARTAAACEANRLRWEERRTDLCDRIGSVAELALDKTEEALHKGETRKASDASAVVARLVDKAQLLSGGSTARFGTDADRAAVVTEARERALALVPRSA